MPTQCPLTEYQPIEATKYYMNTRSKGSVFGVFIQYGCTKLEELFNTIILILPMVHRGDVFICIYWSQRVN